VCERKEIPPPELYRSYRTLEATVGEGEGGKGWDLRGAFRKGGGG